MRKVHKTQVSLILAMSDAILKLESEVKEWKLSSNTWKIAYTNLIKQVKKNSKKRPAQANAKGQEMTTNEYFRSSELQSENATLRAALEHIRGGHGIKDCCVKAFQEDQLDNHDVDIADKALSAWVPAKCTRNEDK